MKLYTEKQLTRYLLDEGIMELSDLANNLIPHIELPTDDEIYERAFQQWGDYSKTSHQNTYLEGAKWMRNKIQGGEQ